MRKILKIAAYLVAGLVGLVILLVIVLKAIPDKQYKTWIIAAVESATERDFNIETLELDLGSSLAFSAGGVRLANADWSSRGDMMSIDHVEADLKLWPLVSGKADFRTVLKTASIIAESNEQGASNWDLGSGSAAEEVEPEPEIADDERGGLGIRPIIRELRLEDIALTVAMFDSEERHSRLEHLRILTPEEDTSLAIEASANGVPIQLNGSLGNIAGALDQLSTPVAIEGTVDQNSLKLLGEWGPIMPEANLDLQVDVKVPSTSAVAALAGVDIGDFGVLELTANLNAVDGIVSLEDIVTRLDGEQTTTRLDGSITNLFLMDGINLGFQADTEALHKVIEELNIDLPVPLPPEVHLSARLTGGKNGLNLDDIKAEVRDQGLQLTAAGAVRNLLTARQVEAQISGSTDSLATLSKYADLPLPHLGSIALSGELASEGEALGLNQLNVRLASENIDLAIDGSVADLLKVKGIEAQTALDIRSLTEQNITELTALLKTFDVDLPVHLLPRSARVSTRVTGDLEQLGLHEIDAQVGDKGIDLLLSGEVANVLKPEGITADIKLNNDSISAFSKYAGTELPELGPLTATAQVRSSGEALGLETMQARLADEALKADITATIVDLLAVSGIQATVKADTGSLAALSDLAQTELPDTAPVNAEMSLVADTLEQAEITLDARTGGAAVKANSTLSLLSLAEDLNLDIEVTAEKMSDFNQLAQQELYDIGPLKLSASANIQPRRFSLDDLNLTVAEDQSAAGKLMLELPAENDPAAITVLHGQLDIPYLDLSFLLPQQVIELEENSQKQESLEEIEETLADEAADVEAPAEQGDAALPTSEPLPPSDRLFSSEPLVYEQLNNYDIDLAVNAARIDLGEAKLRDIDLEVNLHDGLLKVSPIQAFGAKSGELKGALLLDGSQSTPTLDTDITLSQFPMPNLGGRLDLHINIDGGGKSLAELMASLNGQVLLVARDGKISKSLASRFGSGLLSFSGNRNYTELECATLRMDITDGVVDFDKKLAAQLTEVTWRGGGTIDLNTERLKADIAPKPRKGIPISVGGELAGLVSLTGTLKNPRIAPDYSDAAVKYGRYYAYVATGGISLIAEMVANKFRANTDVCAQILDGTVFAGADEAGKNNPPR